MGKLTLWHNKVEILPYFLYEVSVYKVTKNVINLLDSQFYKSDKLLTIRNDTVIKKFKDCSIIKYVDLLGVTKEFVEENNLPIYEIKKKSNKKKKNERTC